MEDLMRTSGKAALAGIALSLAAVLGACSTGASSSSATASASASSPVTVASLIRQAQSEKGLVIYANVPNQYFKPVIAAFNGQYPGISVQVTDLNDQTVFSKYEAEAAQGARTADLLVAWVNQGHGVYVMSAEPVLLGYNAKLLKPADVPHTWSQLAADAKANPAKYQMVTYPISNPLDYAGVYGLYHLLGGGRTQNILQALAPVSKTYNEGLDQLQQVLQGSASLGYMTSGLAQGALQQYKGIAGYTFMQDATPLIPRGIAVTAKAASPASAQLFLDFLYSVTGQQALCAGGFEATMNDFKPAVGCTASLTSLGSQVPAGSTYLVPIDQDVLDQQAKITSQWNQAFHR
jgi:iron(III) transport system substrate-binding protein